MDELKKLYDVLVRDGKYTKSFEEFQVKWGDQSYKDKVYDVVSRDGLYTKDKNSFFQKYSGASTPASAQQPVQQPQEPAQQPVQQPAVEKKNESDTTALPVGASSLAAPLPPTKTKEEDGGILSSIGKGIENVTGYVSGLASKSENPVLSFADDVINSTKKLFEQRNPNIIQEKLNPSDSDYQKKLGEQLKAKIAATKTDTFSPLNPLDVMKVVGGVLENTTSKIINSTLSQEQKNAAIKKLQEASDRTKYEIYKREKLQEETLDDGLTTKILGGIAEFVPDLAVASLMKNPVVLESKYATWTAKVLPSLEKISPKVAAIVEKYTPKIAKFTEEAAKAPMTKIFTVKGAISGAANAKEGETMTEAGIEGAKGGFFSGMYMHGLGEVAGKTSPLIAKGLSRTGMNSAISTAIANPLANAGVFATAKAIRTPIEEGRLATGEELAMEVGTGIGFSLLHAGSLYKNHKELNHYYDNTLKENELGSFGRAINETKANLELTYDPNLTPEQIKEIQEARDEIKKAAILEPDLQKKIELGNEALKLQNKLDANFTVKAIIENKVKIVDEINNQEDLSDEQKDFFTKKVNAIADHFDNSEFGLKKKELNTKITEAQKKLDDAGEKFTNLKTPSDRAEAQIEVENKRKQLEDLNAQLIELVSNKPAEKLADSTQEQRTDEATNMDEFYKIHEDSYSVEDKAAEDFKSEKITGDEYNSILKNEESKIKNRLNELKDKIGENDYNIVRKNANINWLENIIAKHEKTIKEIDNKKNPTEEDLVEKKNIEEDLKRYKQEFIKEKEKLQSLKQTIKTQENAVQKQSTNESVLLTEQPQLGLQEVVEGNEKPEETTLTPEETREVTPEIIETRRINEIGLQPLRSLSTSKEQYEKDLAAWEKNKTEVNAKYDAELAALEKQKTTPEVTPTVTPEVVNVQLNPIEVTTSEPTPEPTTEPTTEPTAEGETKTALQEATEARKKAKALLKSIKEGNASNPLGKLYALVDYHKALVKEAKEFIKEKKGDITEWAKSIGERVNKITKTAWDEATGAIPEITKPEELDYTFEETFGNDIDQLPKYEKTMEDVQLEVDKSYNSIEYLKSVVESAKKIYEKNKSEKTKKRLDEAEAELKQYEGEYFEKSKKDAIKILEATETYKKADDIQKELLVRDVLSRFGEKQKKAPSAEKILGIDKGKQRTIAERDLLINKLRDFSNGAKQGIKSVKEAIKLIRDTVIKSKDLANLSRKDLVKVIDIMKNVRIKDAESLKKAVEKVSDIIEKANKDLVEVSKTKIDKAKIKEGLRSAKETAKSIAEKIKAVKDYFDSVKEFGNLTRKDLEKISKEMLKVKDEASLDKAVDKINDIIDNAKTDILEISEYKMLMDKLRAVKEGTNTLNEKRKVMAEAIDFIKKSGKITSAQAGKLARMINKVDLNNDVKVEKVIEYAESIFEKAEQRRLEEQEAKVASQKKTLIDNILDLVNKKAKTKILASGKRRSRGLDPDGQLFFQSIKEVVTAAAKNDVNKMMDIMTKLASRQPEIDDAVQKEMRGEPLTLDETILLNEVMAFDMFGDMLNMSVDEIETLYDSLKDVRDESISRLKQTRIDSAAKKESMVLEANDIIQDGFGILFNADGTPKSEKDLNQDKKDIYEYFKKLKIWEGVKKYLERYDFNGKNFITNFFRNKLANIGTITNILDKKGSLFKDNVYEKLNKMNEKKRIGIESQTKLLDTLANKIFGTKKDGYQKFKYELAGKGTKKINVSGRDYTFNYGQLLRMYALSLNRIQRGKLEKMGFDSAKMQEIKTALGPEFTKFADDVVEYLSTDYFGTVNDVYRKVNDVNLNQIENYFPTKTVAKEANAQLLQKGDFNGIFNAETSPAFKERLDTTSPIDLEPSFTDVLDNHVETMEMYKSHAEDVKEMNTFFSISSVKTLLDQTGLGPVLKFNINNSISPNANAPIRAKGMDKIINNFTPFALAFKGMQFVKQATSIGAAYGDYSFRKNKQMFLADLPFFIADVAKIMVNPIGNIRKFKNISATFKERYDSGLAGNVASIESGSRTFLPSSQKNTRIGKFKRAFRSAAGFATFAGDIVSTFGYMANYNRDIKNGMNPEKALQKFNDYNATLQTKRPSEKSPIQHNQDFLSRTVTMFGSSGLLMMNTVSQSTKNILRSVSKGESPKTKDIRKLVFAVGVGNALFIAASNAFKLLSGDDEDKDKAKDDIFEALIGLNLLTQLPIIGEAVEYAKSKIKGERYYDSSSTNPMLQVGKKIAKIYDEEQGNIIYALRPIAEMEAGFQFEPFMGLANSVIEGEVSEDDMYDMLGVAKSYRPTGEEEQAVKAEKKATTEEKTNKELESLRELLNTETDGDIRNEVLKRIDYLNMTDDEKKKYKKEKKEEIQADKDEVDALLGEYDSKDDMRRYDKALYEKTFGEDSDYYKAHKAKSKMEAKVRKLEEKAEDKERGYVEPVEEKKSKKNSDGSYKRTYKRSYKSSYKRSYQSGN